MTRSRPHVDAVVFDFDGVLVDSMRQHAAAFRKVLEPLGVPVSDRRVFELEGARSASLIGTLCRDVGRGVGDEEMVRLEAAKQEAFEAAGVPGLYDGAADLVQETARHVQTALVTGTKRRNVERVLGGLADVFDAVLAADAYTHEKPHPEPYLCAAETLGLRPQRCVAVENAVLGLRSARAAGYGQVFGIATTMTAADLSGADAVHLDHPSLRAALMELLGRP